MHSLSLTALLFFFCSVVYAQVADPLMRPLPELPVASLSSVGMNADSVKHLVDLIRSTPPNDFRGLVVIKDNKLVVEEYFHTYWRETIHDVRSAGKSITALLLGIAIDKGLVKSTEQSVYDFFPKQKFAAPLTNAHRDIKIKHLLTMTAGLDAGDDSPGSTGNWLTSDNWVNFALTLPMVFKPGEKWVYADVCPVLIGAIIEETSGKKLADFARENLFTPLGIREYYWYTGVGGRTGPMGNLYLSALDFAKIGMVVLNKGQWQGKKIVSSSWTSDMLQQRVALTDDDSPFAQGYGYFWYTGTREVNHKKYTFHFASGNGGNLLIVIPSENMVVSLISSAYGRGVGHRRSFNILDKVLGAVEKK